MEIELLCALTGATVHEATQIAGAFVVAMIILVVGVFIWESKKVRP